VTEQRKSWLSLAALFLLLLAMAALRPLAVPDEGRYGEIGRWMLQSGDWLTPRLNSIPFFHKPPYLYWLEAISVAVFGAHAWALRLVPALHAGLMLLALYLSARQFTREAVARRAAWMLGSSLSFLMGGQYVNHDMLVASWIGVAIWCFALAFMHGDKPQAALARWGFVACALGVLSKGMIGLALPGLVLLIWLGWTRQLKKVLYLPWLSGLTLFALLAVPWFWLAGQQFPGMLDYMFGAQQVSRFSATTFNNRQPWWFYLPCLLILLFPWALLALSQALAQLRRPALALVSGAGKAAPESAPRAWTTLCWIWLLAILGFFSIPSSKIIGYVLPVIPPLALLAALGWDSVVAWLKLGLPAQQRWFAALCSVCIALALGANIAAARYTGKHSTQDVAQALQVAGAKPSDPLYLISADFAYDLPFYRQAEAPMVVIQDWPALRKSVGDNWKSELLEGATFDSQAARVLQTGEALAQAKAQPNAWLLGGEERAPEGFTLVFKGGAWALYRPQSARPSASEGPKAAQ
jgi:4-amino-4-deoxy-L-arabinose transferase-like glycosyltransferase